MFSDSFCRETTEPSNTPTSATTKPRTIPTSLPFPNLRHRCIAITWRWWTDHSFTVRWFRLEASPSFFQSLVTMVNLHSDPPIYRDDFCLRRSLAILQLHDWYWHWFIYSQLAKGSLLHLILSSCLPHHFFFWHWDSTDTQYFRSTYYIGAFWSCSCFPACKYVGVQFICHREIHFHFHHWHHHAHIFGPWTYCRRDRWLFVG